MVFKIVVCIALGFLVGICLRILQFVVAINEQMNRR